MFHWTEYRHVTAKVACLWFILNALEEHAFETANFYRDVFKRL